MMHSSFTSIIHSLYKLNNHSNKTPILTTNYFKKMPMNNIEYANYNQTTIPCKYCPSEVKRSRLPFHVSKCHKDELLKERSREQEVIAVEFSDTPSFVPKRPICHIVPNDDTESWDDSNSSTYNALLATSNKPVIRGSYYIGRNSQEKQRCREFECARMALIKERSPENFGTSYEPEVSVPAPQPAIDNGSDSSEVSWSESSLSMLSTGSELNEDSFKSCNSGSSNISTHANLSTFELSVAEYLANLSDEKRAKVVRKFNKIMQEL